MANETESSGDFPKAYMRFRTVLDGLELTAMRYSLKDDNVAQRIARMKEFEQVLMPIITKYQNQTKTNQLIKDCPDGCNNCGGVCVPYECP